MIAASKYIGVFESENAKSAIEKAEERGDYYVSICHQCAREIEIGDVYEFDADEVDD